MATTPPSVHGPGVWVCDAPGCGKSYRKNARLVEHERVHTGEVRVCTDQRPFACLFPGCGASYRRATHLSAHARSHKDAVMKPFACPQPGCAKAFWTAQHLHRHQVACHAGERARQGVSSTELAALGDTSNAGLYPCTQCDRFFSKRAFLRLHMREAHADQDERYAAAPFGCEFPGCTKRFPTNAKRTQHARLHAPDRYMCTHPHEGAAPTFSTWTELQRHTKACHPPRCPYPACDGRTFASRDNLRKHMRSHEDEASDAHACAWNGCEAAFSTAYALRTHIATVHRHEKPYVCDECGQRFGHRHLLRKHTCATTAPPHDTLPLVTPLLHTEARKRARRERVLPCPWAQLAGPDTDACPRLFARLYDLRRHMNSAHALATTDAELAALFPDVMRALPPSRVKRKR